MSLHEYEYTYLSIENQVTNNACVLKKKWLKDYSRLLQLLLVTLFENTTA